jgi:tRNA(Ile)-lysidine synthase
VEVLELLDLPHLDDPSNDDLTFRRNRVRHRVIPELAALDPGFGGGLIRAVEHAATDARFVEAVSDACYQQVTRRDQGRVELPRGWLTELDPALATRVVRRAVLELIVGDSREMTAERTLAVIQAAGGWSGATIELPYGIVARVERDVVAISRVT